jgi:hypothetical protein
MTVKRPKNPARPSKISIKRRLKTIPQKAPEAREEKSKLKNTGSRLGGIETNPLVKPETSVIPRGIPMIVTIIMLKRSEYLNLRAKRTPVTKMPMTPKRAGPSVKLPNTYCFFATGDSIIPELKSPIWAIIKPIPAATAARIQSGTSFKTFSRAGDKDKITNKIPEIKTAVRAEATPKPCETATVTKKTFRPIPGATAKGRLATKAIIKVAKSVAKIVAVKKASLGIPVSARIMGFTAIT